jgi:hypothetical protein
MQIKHFLHLRSVVLVYMHISSGVVDAEVVCRIFLKTRQERVGILIKLGDQRLHHKVTVSAAWCTELWLVQRSEMVPRTTTLDLRLSLIVVVKGIAKLKMTTWGHCSIKNVAPVLP